MIWKRLTLILTAVSILAIGMVFLLLIKIKRLSMPPDPIAPDTVEEVIDYHNAQIDTTIQELTRNDSSFMKAVIDQRNAIKEANEIHRSNITRIRRLNDDSTVRELSKNLSGTGSHKR